MSYMLYIKQLENNGNYQRALLFYPDDTQEATDSGCIGEDFSRVNIIKTICLCR